MILGVKFKANPTEFQKKILSQWMGCARFIWNAKCDENKYFTMFARRYYPIGTYAPIDQQYSQFKSKELSPWLYDCPSVLLRNSVSNWYATYQDFMRGRCGKPKRKPKTDKGSIYLTRELFRFEKCEDGVTRLYIGTKKHKLGHLSLKAHRDFKEPKSLYIRRACGQYFVSFCYENEQKENNTKELFKSIQGKTEDWYQQYVVGIDRGVAIPVHTGQASYDFSEEQKKKKLKTEQILKRLQRRLAQQIKGSLRRDKTKYRISKKHSKISNIREDFCHQTSRALVNTEAKVFIFEDLRTSKMSRKPKVKIDTNGKYLSNKASQKAGLNKSILDKGWHKIETYTNYKALKEKKVVLKVAAHHTSQECADCGHIHPDNRKNQSRFQCISCGHMNNADRNASLVIKKRAIKAIQDSGTELLGKGIPVLSTGRGAKSKPRKRHLSLASGKEASKKTRRTAATAAA